MWRGNKIEYEEVTDGPPCDQRRVQENENISECEWCVIPMNQSKYAISVTIFKKNNLKKV